MEKQVVASCKSCETSYRREEQWLLESGKCRVCGATVEPLEDKNERVDMAVNRVVAKVNELFEDLAPNDEISNRLLEIEKEICKMKTSIVNLKQERTDLKSARKKRKQGREVYAKQRKEQDKQDKLERQLVKQGHTCISILETYPSQLRWCKQQQCAGKRDSH